MDDDLAATFEANRPRLQSMAYRMLGSLTEAEDAVQETWIRLSGSDAERIDNLGGWLTTVVSRVCMGMLRARRTRREEPIEAEGPAPEGLTPEEEAVLAETMGPALLIVLDTLTPAERLAFVLHDLFAVPFDDVAPIVGRSPAAARQLASRARRRVQGTDEIPSRDRRRQQEIVDAFLAASRQGDYEALVSLLDPDAVLRADRAAVEMAAANRDRGAPLLAPEVRGARGVATALVGRATAAKSALIEGTPGAAWVAGGRARAAFAFHIVGDTIAEIEIVTDPAVVAALDIEILARPSQTG
ncbi:MAG TPA: sigma-70 family RNA polymerase sigma factor [Acidimicrobiales bacterium]|nr:sigma-70 family RNA polymerase sigma factor [Acidimicrobiales bacterium]